MTLLYAWMLVSIGKTNSLGPLISGAERWLASASSERLGEKERQASLGHIAALQAVQAANMGNAEAAGQYVAEALRFSSPENAPIRGLAWLAQANLHRYLGRFKEAITAYLEALPLMPLTGAFSGTCNMIVTLGQVYLVQGQLAEAEDVYRSNLALTSGTAWEKTPAVGILQCGLAEVVYEQDRLDEARSLLNDSEANSRRCNMIGLLSGLAILGARLTRTAGDLPGAIQRLAEAETLFRLDNSPILHAEISAWLARFQAEAGHLSEAVDWAGGVKPCPESNPGYTHGVELFSLARVLIYQGHLEEAFRLTVKLEGLAAIGGSQSRVVEARLLQAEILWMQNQRAAGLGKLGDSLELTERCGLRRLFLDEGTRLAPLLVAWQSTMPTEGRRRGLASWLLERFRTESRLVGTAETTQQETAAPDLTGREMDVLRGLIDGLSYSEIANKLVISTGTVKTHVSHIYAKLCVEGRTQAIRRAKELKIG
jgi:LuxR family maltose regulon positive regulatory protein